MRTRVYRALPLFLFLWVFLLNFAPRFAAGQAGNAGTLTGIVLDPTGALIPGATVVLDNPLSRYTRTATTGSDGAFQFQNLPYNPYELTVTSAGFNQGSARVEVRSSVPVTTKITLAVAGADQTVTIEAQGDLLETSPTAHTDIDREVFTKLPLTSPSSGLSSLLTLAVPGVAADSNGLIHGLGDHAENAFYEDGQPFTDQQSKVFSNQIPISAIQSLEVIGGAPPAEFGEKTSLVAVITTRSGTGVTKPRGNITASYGSFGSGTLSADLAYGKDTYGNFLAIDGLQTGRFLDPAEFRVFHDKGNEVNVFDRLDFQPDAKDSLHTNFQYTRSWFQTPNSYDNLNLTDQNGVAIANTDQRSKIGTIDIAPSITRVLNERSVLTGLLWLRRDKYNYYPSRNPLSDFGPLQRETASQDRDLTNAGTRADYNYVKGSQNVKAGASYQQTLLNERFALGIVDPSLNAPCLDATGAPMRGFNDPSQCVANGFTVNPNFNPLLGCYDLTRGTPSAKDGCAAKASASYRFAGHTDVKLLSLYAQDLITKGNFNINVGIRGDFYNGLTSERQAEPRVGVAYHVQKTETVLRTSYARTLETPFNENLIISGKGCGDGVISALVPCIPANFNPGYRNEFHAGLEQSFGKHLVISGDYLWKYTHNGYDFSVLGSTPITFPIEWHTGKVTGFDLRLTVPNYRGFTAFVVMSSVAARFLPPQIGGLGATQQGGAPFRIDHDEKFNQTSHLQYQFRTGPYLSFNWKYDSGLVAGRLPFAVDDATPVDLTVLSGDQQQQAGLYCGNVAGTVANPLTTCAPSQYHSNLVSIPAPGTQDPDRNPARIAPRSLFDLAVGQDNLFHGDTHTFSARLTVINLANKYALYNFLSTFSGTHYVTPRTITAEIGYHF